MLSFSLSEDDLVTGTVSGKLLFSLEDVGEDGVSLKDSFSSSGELGDNVLSLYLKKAGEQVFSTPLVGSLLASNGAGCSSEVLALKYRQVFRVSDTRTFLAEFGPLSGSGLLFNVPSESFRINV